MASDPCPAGVRGEPGGVPLPDLQTQVFEGMGRGHRGFLVMILLFGGNSNASHPLGCHRPRIPGRVVFEKSVQVHVFGCAYHRIADGRCLATTLRERRDEWIELG
jgi:hypothetical protein